MVLYGVLQRLVGEKQGFEIGVGRTIEGAMFRDAARLTNEDLPMTARMLRMEFTGVPEGFSPQAIEEFCLKNGWFYASFTIRAQRLFVTIMPRPGKLDLAEGLAQAFIEEIRALDHNMTNDFHVVRTSVAIEPQVLEDAHRILAARSRTELSGWFRWDNLRFDHTLDFDGLSIYKYRLSKVS